MKFSGLALGVAIWGVAAGANAGEADVPRAVVEKFRAIKALTADFHEEKRMAILEAPIVRSGTIAYESPGRLAMDVTQPSPSRLVLDRNVLTMTDGQQRHVIDIDKQPAVGLLVRLLLGVLAGDVDGLKRHATVAFRTGSPAERSKSKGKKTDRAGTATEPWSMDLDPQDPLLAKLIKHMSVAGHDAIIDVLTIVDGNGDRTVTRFANVKLLDGFSPADRATRFGAHP
jgi:hypothetical protein